MENISNYTSIKLFDYKWNNRANFMTKGWDSTALIKKILS